MKMHVRSLTMLMSFLLAVSFLPISAADAAEMPKELQAIADKAKSAAGDCAQQLTGAWGDQHVALIASKKKGDFADYKSMQTALNGLLAKSGAMYIYVLSPSGAFDKDPFFVTVDGSAEPDDYGTEYKWEAGFASAWGGMSNAAEMVSKDDKGKLQLSAYSPIRDTKGEVVAILGLDYPAPEAANFPDWIEKE